LEQLLEAANRVFPKRTEYTFEAGRPDSIDREKLRLLKSYGVTRLAINTQTTNDNTLKTIGRDHTRAQFFNAIEMARIENHDNINVDLILGLPGESVVDVQNSLKEVLAHKPENLTAHILAVKRASRLKEEMISSAVAGSDKQTVDKMPAIYSHMYSQPGYGEPTRDEIIAMLHTVECMTADFGMHPYYMYRQKNMLGNFENVGYATDGFECIYNVMIMSESQTVLAFGAGAITKTVDNEHIERIFNVKNAEDYIRRIDEMIKRKREYFQSIFSLQYI
jgi:oxygen-independent coproporphyrinogen-3 oxidase